MIARGPSIFGETERGSVYSWGLGSVSGGNRFLFGEGTSELTSCGGSDGSMACNAFGKSRFSGGFPDNLGYSGAIRVRILRIGRHSEVHPGQCRAIAGYSIV